MGLMISKVIAQLLMPPTVFIIGGLAGVMFWRARWAKWLVFGSLLVLWALSIEPVRDQLIGSLENRYPPFTQTEMKQWAGRQDAVIVLLGGGVYRHAPEFGGGDSLRDDAMQRTLFASIVQQNTGLPVYATGGAPLQENETPEAEVMRQWLLRLGVSESMIYVENAARNTWENAALTQTLLDKAGIRRVLLVTNAWHMPRSAWCFEQHGLEVVAVPVDFSQSQLDYDLRSWLPQAGILNETVLAWHEYMGLLWYRFRYSADKGTGEL